LLSTIFTLAVKHKVAASNPCKEVALLPENNWRTRYLLDEEEPRLLQVLTGPREHLRALVIVAIGTGMRRGDQLNLRWEKVDFQRNVIYVPNSKTGKDYAVPMDEDVRDVLLHLRQQGRRDEYVFINPGSGKPYTELKKAFGTACRLAGIVGLHWHDLRHTFGTRLAESGCSEATIAGMMGHSDPATTRRYTHATDRAKHAAVEAVKAGRVSACHSPATEEKRRPKLAAVNS
jgi:integrase